MKFILILLTVISIGCTSTSETNKVTETTTEQTAIASTVSVLSVADFKSKIENLQGQDFFLVDVRTAGEVAAGTIDNSTNIDYNSSSFSDDLGKLDKEKPLLLFCQAGSRSARAADIAKNLGFVEIYDLGGGYRAWSAQ